MTIKNMRFFARLLSPVKGRQMIFYYNIKSAQFSKELSFLLPVGVRPKRGASTES